MDDDAECVPCWHFIDENISDELYRVGPGMILHRFYRGMNLDESSQYDIQQYLSFSYFVLYL